MRHNKLNLSQSCAFNHRMILPCHSLCMFFISSFPTLLCTIHIYIYTCIPNSYVTLLPRLRLSSNSASRLPTAFSWGWSTVQWCSNQPSSTGCLHFLMGLPQGSSCLERAMTGRRRRRKRWASAWQHREVPIISCRRRLYSRPEALLWLKAVSTWETAGTNVLTLIIWITFVHYILQ